MEMPFYFGGRVESAEIQQKVTIVPSGAGVGSAPGGKVEMQICLGGERSWETNSGVPFEPEEVDAEPSAHSEDDEDTEEFLSRDWD